MIKETNIVLEGDCLELLKRLPDSSVDLICSDPPFFAVKGGSRNGKGKFEWWDRQWKTEQEFLAWLREIATEWQRVLKPNGSLYCFASTKMAAKVEVMLSDVFCVLSNIRWIKDSGWHKKLSKEEMRKFTSSTESIIFCEQYGSDNMAKGEAGYAAKCDELRGFIFEPLRAYLDEERIRAGLHPNDVNLICGYREKGGCAGRHWFSKSQWELPIEEKYRMLQAAKPGFFLQQYEELKQQYEELRRPFNVTAEVPYTDVWSFPTVSYYEGKHPCEKPAELLEHIISASSRKGATVLDCFGGSGSTGLAAQKLGRNYILFEIDPHWVAQSKQRLGEATMFASESSRTQWLEQVTGQKHKKDPQLSLFDIAPQNRNPSSTKDSPSIRIEATISK